MALAVILITVALVAIVLVIRWHNRRTDGYDGGVGAGNGSGEYRDVRPQ